MNSGIMLTKVVCMIAELREKIEKDVPPEGPYPLVYAEFKNPDKTLCLTDVMLELRALPEYIDNYRTHRLLSCVGYKLPVPYKSTMTVMKGTKEEVLNFLSTPETADRIVSLIPRLSDNLEDV